MGLWCERHSNGSRWIRLVLRMSSGPSCSPQWHCRAVKRPVTLSWRHRRVAPGERTSISRPACPANCGYSAMPHLSSTSDRFPAPEAALAPSSRTRTMHLPLSSCAVVVMAMLLARARWREGRSRAAAGWARARSTAGESAPCPSLPAPSTVVRES